MFLRLISMKSRPWLRVYILLFVGAMAVSLIGIAQSCPVIDDGMLLQGCDHDRIATTAWGHFLNWMLISGAAVLVGTVIAVARRRRPSLRSFVVWGSAGMLELAIVAAWYISPGYLAIPLLALAACAVLAAVAAGVSLAAPMSSVDTAESAAITTGG